MIEDKKKIIAVVSARGGSKGIPKKNIKNLNGKPLIYYSLAALSRLKRIDKVVLSSDDDKILKVANKLKLNIDLNKRPHRLAKDNTPLTSVAQYESKRLHNAGYKHGYVLQISPASPFLNS